MNGNHVRKELSVIFQNETFHAKSEVGFWAIAKGGVKCRIFPPTDPKS